MTKEQAEAGARDDDLPERELIGEIEAFCARHQISPSELGRLAVGDRGMMTTLRQGREMRRATRSRVRAFMADYQPAAAQ